MEEKSLLEAVRMEVWRGAARIEASVAAELERDRSVLQELRALRSSTQEVVTALAVQAAVATERATAAAESRWEDQLWAVVEVVLMYFGTARAMAALGLANYAFGGRGSATGRVAALALALLLDAGVVVLVAVPQLGGDGRYARLWGCFRRWWPASGREETASAREDGGGWFSGGVGGFLMSLWGRRRPAPGGDAGPADSPV
jgi:hypothetical protein